MDIKPKVILKEVGIPVVLGIALWYLFGENPPKAVNPIGKGTLYNYKADDPIIDNLKSLYPLHGAIGLLIAPFGDKDASLAVTRYFKENDQFEQHSIMLMGSEGSVGSGYMYGPLEHCDLEAPVVERSLKIDNLAILFEDSCVSVADGPSKLLLPATTEETDKFLEAMKVAAEESRWLEIDLGERKVPFNTQDVEQAILMAGGTKERMRTMVADLPDREG